MRTRDHSRQILLFVVAVVLPCLLLVALSLRMIGQEQELAEKRAAEDRQRLASEIRQELLSRLERIKGQEVDELRSDPEYVTEAEYQDRLVVSFEKKVPDSRLS